MKVLENRQRDKRTPAEKHDASSITDVPDVRNIYIYTLARCI